MNVGIAEESPKGSSKCRTKRETRSTASGRTTISRWSVWYWRATIAAYSNSLKALSSKPIENVRTGSGDARAMDATTELESMPPLKKAPNGTSAIIRMRTESSNFFFSCRRRHTRLQGDWSSDVCSSDLDSPAHQALVLLRQAAVDRQASLIAC